MAYATLLTSMKLRLGRRAASFLDSDFLAEMILAQERLEQAAFLPRFLKKTSGDEVTTAGEFVVSALPPAGFLRLWDDMPLSYDDEGGNEHEAKKVDTYQELVSKYNAGIATGIIYFYFDPSNNTFHIRPEQSRDVTFRCRYFGADTVLSGANDNLWTAKAGELLMAEAGLMIASSLRDTERMQFFATLQQGQRNKLIRADEAEAQAGSDYTMGEPD